MPKDLKTISNMLIVWLGDSNILQFCFLATVIILVTQEYPYTALLILFGAYISVRIALMSAESTIEKLQDIREEDFHKQHPEAKVSRKDFFSQDN